MKARTSREPQVTSEIVDVTPEIAQKWLVQNVKNRGLRQKIDLYARDMMAGNWQMTGEAIKFDRSGNLLDGQHRLHAVIRSDVTVPMLVVFGLAPEAQTVMDTGASRSPADALHLQGHRNARTIATAALAHEAWTAGYFKTAMWQSSYRATNSEVLRIIEERPGLAESADFARLVYRTLPLPTGALAAVHYELVRVDADDCNEFFSRIRDLRTTGRGDPVFTLLKRVSEIRERRERIWASTSIYYLVRSWNACRTGEDLNKFQLGSELRGWVQIPEPK